MMNKALNDLADTFQKLSREHWDRGEPTAGALARDISGALLAYRNEIEGLANTKAYLTGPAPVKQC